MHISDWAISALAHVRARAPARARARALFRRGTVERAFDEEIRFHIEMETAANLRRGMSPDAARRAALVAFGGVERMKEEHRDARGVHLLEDAAADARFAARWLRRSPGFSVASILTLGLGIGGTVAVFSVVNGVLLKPLPYAEPERLVAVWSMNLQLDGEPFTSSPPDFRELRSRAHLLDGMAAHYRSAANVVIGDEPERVEVERVSPSLFRVLGVSPAIGRAFADEEETFGRHRVLVVSDRFWRTRLNAAPTALGSAMQVNGEPFTVVGIMPPSFRFPDASVELWMPMAFEEGDSRNTRGNYFLLAVGRLKPGATREAAEAELSASAALVAAEHPGSSMAAARLVPLHEQTVGETRRTLLLLLGATALVLIIACANVAGLLLARAAGRRREIAIRAGIGAGRGRLVRQLITESALLSGIGGLCGLAVAWACVRLLVRVGPSELPRLGEITVDARALLLALLLCMIATLAFGVWPALRATRLDLHTALRDSGRSSPSRSHQRLRHALVGAQVSLAIVLLIGCGLLVRSFARVARVDPGFRADDLLTLSISLPRNSYTDARRQWAFADELHGRVGALSGVDGAAITSGLSLRGGWWGKQLTLADRPLPTSSDQVPAVGYRLVSHDYFSTLGIRLLKGRRFDANDHARSPGVAVINETMARRFWPQGDPIGKTIWMGPPEHMLADRLAPDYRFPRLTIVGVVADERFAALDAPPGPEVYQLYAQSTERGPGFYVVVRTRGDPAALAAAVRREVRALDRGLPVAEVATMRELMRASTAARRFSMGVVAAFAGLALILTTVGIYGVVAHYVAQRQREIGIRMALGAASGSVVGLVVAQGLRTALIGAAVGVAGALAATRLMSGMLFEVPATDPLTFGGITLLLLVVAAAASWLPASRAARISPASTLRLD